MPNSDLYLRVNPDGPISVFMQIENQIQFAIASGRLKQGEVLPSVRDLASTLNVNPNTITKAFRDLEIMGLVTARRGIGVTVSANGRDACKKLVESMVHQHLCDAVGECMSAGFSSAKITKLVNDCIKSGYRPYGAAKKSR